MKNILFHSGEFWFNEAGFPEKPIEWHLTNLEPVDTRSVRYLAELGEHEFKTKEYEHALQLALADSVKFADQDAIKFRLFVRAGLDTNYAERKYFLNLWQPEGQTFFVEGIEVQCQIMIKTQWRQIPCMYFKNETRPKRKVAVLSNSFEDQLNKLRTKMKKVNEAIDNSPVKSETKETGKQKSYQEMLTYLISIRDSAAEAGELSFLPQAINTMTDIITRAINHSEYDR